MMRFSFVLLLLAPVACSSSGGSGNAGGADSLDCTLIGKADNCYKTTVAPATSCLPDPALAGVLSSDLATCTYGSGFVVTFNPPLVLPVTTDTLINFEVAQQGQSCLKYEEPNQDGFRVTTSAGTFTETLSGAALTMTCPNGASYSSSNPLALLGCDGGLGAGLPGKMFSGGANSFTFSLLGTTTGSTKIFDCQAF